MKEDILITELDYTRLCNMIQSAKSTKIAEGKNLDALGSEIKRAKRIDPRAITPEYITMNSVIELTDLDTGRLMNLKLVYPGDADFTKGFVSVLSPLGSALIGYKSGDIVSFDTPKGTKKIRIDKILYQPEANGQFDI